MEFRFDTVCGIYCGACGALRATQNGRLEEVSKIVDQKPEDLICYGCKSANVARAWDCESCDFKVCAAEKGVEYCFECDDYPCKKLQDFDADEHPHHTGILENLERIREIGLEEWLKERKERWQCPECGTPFTWYEKECSNCGAKLYNCIEAARDRSESD